MRKRNNPGGCCCEDPVCSERKPEFFDEFDGPLSNWSYVGSSSPNPWRTDGGFLESRKEGFSYTGPAHLFTPFRWQVTDGVQSLDVEAQLETGDPLAFRYSDYYAYVGIESPIGNPSETIGMMLFQRYDELESTWLYQWYRRIGTVQTALTAIAEAPADGVVRILVERVPATSPQSWLVRMYLDGDQIWTGETTIPNLWNNASCVIQPTYYYSGETFVIGTIRQPTGFVRFRSDYFAAVLTQEGA